MAQTDDIRLYQTGDTSGGFGTTKLDQMSNVGDDYSACDAAYEGADFFEVGYWKGMHSHSSSPLPHFSCL